MNKAFCLLCCALFWGCSKDAQLAGTSEHGNAIVVGWVYTPDGKPGEGARVTLRDESYLAVSAMPAAKPATHPVQTVIGADGRFRIGNLDSGNYAIEVRDTGGGALLLHCTLTGRTAQTDLAPDTLRPTATITGFFDTTQSRQHPLQVEAYGLDASAPVGSSGRFTLSGMPSGSLNLRIAAKDNLITPILIQDVAAISGGTTDLPFASWASAKKITINTTAAGANVGENIRDFPLLVRLNKSVFDFSKAERKGQDIRFTKTNGSPLPYEIESWDSTGALASVWVKLDTVFGNDSGQYISLWYGKPGAQSLSSGPSVFAPATDYRAVWHFQEKAGPAGAKGFYKDATGNGYDADNYVASADFTGCIGNGLGFDGSGDYLALDSPLADFGKSDLTLEVWAKVTAAGGSLLYKGQSRSLWSDGGKLFYFGDSAQALSGGAYPSITGFGNGVSVGGAQPKLKDFDHFVFRWKYLTGDSGTVTIFQNGSPLLNSRDGFRVAITDSLNAKIWIGAGPALAAGQFLTGALDELRVSQVARSDAWIRLCYQTQRSSTSILRFK